MMLHPESPRRARLLAVFVLLAAFGAGLVAGTAVDRLFAAAGAAELAAGGQEAHDTAGQDRGERDAGDDDDRDRERRRGRSPLQQIALTDEQRAQIDSIQERRQEQIDSIWEDAAPRLRAISDSTRADVRAVLTPAQRDELERLWEERRRSWRANRDRDDR